LTTAQGGQRSCYATAGQSQGHSCHTPTVLDQNKTTDVTYLLQSIAVNDKNKIRVITSAIIFGPMFVKRFALFYQTVVCLSVCLVLSCPVCDLGVLWPNGWTDQDETWHAGRSRPRPHCVRWRPSSPQNGHSPPIFGPRLLWPNGCMYQDTT